MGFQQELDQIRNRIEGNLPPRAVRVMHEATAALRGTGIEDSVAGVGETAPNFSLKNAAGETLSLEEARRRGPVVLTFYRGVWCPYCNADLENLQRHLSELEAAGATLLALSPEQPEFSRKMISTRKLSYDILFDRGNEVAAAYGLRWQVRDPLKSLYRDSLNINLSRYHGDDDWTLPIPARFVVSTTGRVLYAEASADYTQRPDPDDLLRVVKSVC